MAPDFRSRGLLLESLWAAARRGRNYVQSLLLHSLVPAAVASVLGCVPLGLCSNWAARMLVAKPRGEGHVWATAFNPISWSAADVAACDPTSYFTFWAARTFTLVGHTSMPIAIFTCIWSGGSRGQLLLAAVGAVVHGAMAFMRVFALSRGILTAPGLKAWLSYPIIAFPVATILGVGLLGAPAGHRRSVLVPAVMLATSSGCCATAVRLAWNVITEASWITHSLTLFGLNSLRGLALHVAVHATLRIPEASLALQVFVNVVILSLPTATICLLQVSGRDPLRVALMFVLLMASELLRSSSMLSGFTEIEGSWSMVTRGWRCFRRTCGPDRSLKAVVPAAAVPDAPEPEPMEPRDPAEPQQPGEIAEQETREMRKLLILTEVVAVSNSVELVALVCTAVLFLVARVNSSERGGAPLAWTTVLANFSMGFGSELLTDFVVGMISKREHPHVDAAYLVGANRGRRPGERLAIAVVILMAVLSAFTELLAQMCPSPVPGTAELRSISACPSRA